MEGEAAVGYFLYIGSRGDVLDIFAREITTGKRTANDVQVENYGKVVSFFFKLEHRRTLAKAFDAVTSVNDPPADFTNAASDNRIVENEIFEQHVP